MIRYAIENPPNLNSVRLVLLDALHGCTGADNVDEVRSRPEHLAEAKRLGIETSSVMVSASGPVDQDDIADVLAAAKRCMRLTPEQAQAEYDAAPAIPLSDKRIKEIVEYATSNVNWLAMNRFQLETSAVQLFAALKAFSTWRRPSRRDWENGAVMNEFDSMQDAAKKIVAHVEGMVGDGDD